jgi:hypothetical protein
MKPTPVFTAYPGAKKAVIATSESDVWRPRFARHGQHVAAILAAGGFPALPS